MLPAGFVRESVYDGLLGDSDDMCCAVYEIKISDISYKRLTKFLSHMEKKQGKISLQHTGSSHVQVQQEV